VPRAEGVGDREGGGAEIGVDLERGNGRTSEQEGEQGTPQG
jgi:hypothetical protein